MAKTRIEDLSAVEEMNKAEQQAVQGGGLKKIAKKANKVARSKDVNTAVHVSADVGYTTASIANSVPGVAADVGNALDPDLEPVPAKDRTFI